MGGIPTEVVKHTIEGKTQIDIHDGPKVGYSTLWNSKQPKYLGNKHRRINDRIEVDIWFSPRKSGTSTMSHAPMQKVRKKIVHWVGPHPARREIKKSVTGKLT